MKQIIIILLLVLGTSSIHSQERVGISLHQDARLLVLGDKDHNIDAGTIDIVVSLKMQGNQQQYGYLTIYPSFEYAELSDSTYKRWSANIGYTFNKLIVDNFEILIAGGYGWIDRWSVNMSSFGADAILNYKLTNNIKLSLMSQLTDRRDINKIKYSGFIGIQYDF